MLTTNDVVTFEQPGPGIKICVMFMVSAYISNILFYKNLLICGEVYFCLHSN